MEIEAEKILKRGRIHIKASVPPKETKYVINTHFDSEKHIRWLRRPTLNIRSYSLDDCRQVRIFANEHIIPLILKHRTHYRLRTKNKPKWKLKAESLRLLKQ